MTSSPLIKPERQGVSFALIGWTARETAVGEPEFVGFGGPRGRDRAQFPDFDSQFVGRKEPKFVELEHNL